MKPGFKSLLTALALPVSLAVVAQDYADSFDADDDIIYEVGAIEIVKTDGAVGEMLRKARPIEPGDVEAPKFAITTRNTTFNYKQVTINSVNFQILNSNLRMPHMPGHSFIFKDATWVFSVTSRTMTSMCNRNTVRCTQTTKMMSPEQISCLTFLKKFPRLCTRDLGFRIKFQTPILRPH